MAPEATTPADRMLRLIATELDGCPDIELEFSIRLCRRSIQAHGRFCIWVGDPEAGSAAFARLLQRLQAPAVVHDGAAQAPAVRLGLGVAVGDGGLEFRCYRHDRVSGTSKDRYRSWRWRADDGGGLGGVSTGTYEFHFMPETPDGRTPVDLVDRTLQPAFAALVAEARFRIGSGFWLRTGRTGEVDQVDLAFPWHPLLGELHGLGAVASALEIAPSELAVWGDLPIRHIAAGGAAPATVYASAPKHSAWPDSETALHAQVRDAARQLRDEIDRRIYRRLPDGASGASGIDLDRFYGGDPVLWRAVLGEDLHYHAGLFASDDLDPSDAAMDTALRRAVTELFPLIERGSRVYDIGCGWGGALAMLGREHDCATLGLTISRGQFRHVAGLGLPVRWGDAEATLPPGRFDCALLLESFSHIVDKPRLLRVLRLFADRLVMRVNCQDAAPPATRFGGTMRLVSSVDLRDMLAETGWQVRHWQDRRQQAIPSVMVWQRRLTRLPPTQDPHLETLRSWCTRIAAMPREWAANNPLIEVMAE